MFADMIALLLLGFLAHCVASFKIDPGDYLEKYGYLDSSNKFGGFHDAVISFQKFFSLPLTGLLDDATLKIMQQPRCGVKDFEDDTFLKSGRNKRYTANARLREDSPITYTYLNYSEDLGREKTRQLIERALETWSNVTNVLFKEVSGSNADLEIKFGRGKHGCSHSFDGKGGTLAHASYPRGSKVHFDEDEDFTDGDQNGIDLFRVAAHEFGHSLGIPHSPVREALMYPVYRFRPNFKLPIDDIGAVTALYGCKKVNKDLIAIPKDGAPYSGLLMEEWSNKIGKEIQHIKSNVCEYPHRPDNRNILQFFETPAYTGDNYARRIRGYFQPRTPGFYRFYLCGDYSVNLYFSLTPNPSDKELIMELKKPTARDLERCQFVNSTKKLIAGQSYYIEAVQKEDTYIDFLKVGAQAEGGNLELITSYNTKWAIPGANLRTIICKGRYETIICPTSHQIEIIKAAYGIFTSNYKFFSKVKKHCDFNYWSRSGAKFANCVAKSSMQVVQQLCQGQQQCTLYAQDSEFRDHCGRWVYSVLDVTYKCIYKGPATTAPPKPTRPTKAPTAAPTPGKCIDRYEEAKCNRYKRIGYCKYEQVKMMSCKKTCQACSEPCEDKRSITNCQRYRDQGMCERSSYVREMYCRKTCRTCA